MTAAFSFPAASEIGVKTIEHLGLSLGATAIAAVLGVPAGCALARRPRARRAALALANAVQTIPSLAIFGLLLPVVGIGAKTAMIALVLYGVLPILKNTTTGILGIDPVVREAGRALGMTDRDLLRRVELPLALGTILAGVRLAAVIAVGLATIGTLIGAGGLGDFIWSGISNLDTGRILAGALPAAALALAIDAGLGAFERTVTPRR